MTHAAESADHPSCRAVLAVGQRVRTQNAKRIAVIPADDCFYFVVCFDRRGFECHRPLLWQVVLAELHLHLEGSIEPETLARDRSVAESTEVRARFRVPRFRRIHPKLRLGQQATPVARALRPRRATLFRAALIAGRRIRGSHTFCRRDPLERAGFPRSSSMRSWPRQSRARCRCDGYSTRFGSSGMKARCA